MQANNQANQAVEATSTQRTVSRLHTSDRRVPVGGRASPHRWAATVMMTRMLCCASCALLVARGLCGTVDYDAQFRMIATNMGLVLGGTNGSALKKAEMGSPLLVEPTNTAPKLSLTTNCLAEMCRSGSLAGVRLGANMTDVVTAWGKPPYMLSSCGGGPRFVYADVALVFRDGALASVELGRGGAKYIANSMSVTFTEGVSLGSSYAAWRAALAQPQWQWTTNRGISRCCALGAGRRLDIVGLPEEDRVSRIDLTRVPFR